MAGCSGGDSTGAAPTPVTTPASTTSAGPTATSTTTTTTTVAPSPTVSTPASCADRLLAGMSPAERAGQVLMVGAEQPAAADLAPLVRRHHLGGVFLAGRWRLSPSALLARTAQVQAAAEVPLLISVDQEGGKVQGLSGPGWATIPSGLQQGRWTPEQLRGRVGGWAAQLARTGVRMNLAPVADVVAPAMASENPPIGAIDRQYGSDPATVADDVAVSVGAFQQAGVLATVKHFPGLGRVRVNTDTGTRATDSVATVTDPNLAPFRAAIEADVAAVMISSARYPKLDAKNLAAFSPAIVTGLLRGRLGYDGLVVSDDFGRAEAVARYAPGDRAVRFLAAGGDLVLTVTASDAGPMTRALVARAAASPAFRARLETAARRVLVAKQGLDLLAC